MSIGKSLLCFEGSQCHLVHGQAPLKSCNRTWHNIPEDLNLQQCCCKNLESHVTFIINIESWSQHCIMWHPLPVMHINVVLTKVTLSGKFKVTVWLIGRLLKASLKNRSNYVTKMITIFWGPSPSCYSFQSLNS